MKIWKKKLIFIVFNGRVSQLICTMAYLLINCTSIESFCDLHFWIKLFLNSVKILSQSGVVSAGLVAVGLRASTQDMAHGRLLNGAQPVSTRFMFFGEQQKVKCHENDSCNRVDASSNLLRSFFQVIISMAMSQQSAAWHVIFNLHISKPSDFQGACIVSTLKSISLSQKSDWNANKTQRHPVNLPMKKNICI